MNEGAKATNTKSVNSTLLVGPKSTRSTMIPTRICATAAKYPTNGNMIRFSLTVNLFGMINRATTKKRMSPHTNIKLKQPLYLFKKNTSPYFAETQENYVLNRGSLNSRNSGYRHRLQSLLTSFDNTSISIPLSPSSVFLF